MHNPARRRAQEQETVTTSPKGQSVKSTSPEPEAEEAESVEEEEQAPPEGVKEEPQEEEEPIEIEEQQDDTETDVKSEVIDDDDIKAPEESALDKQSPPKTGMKCKHCGCVFANRGALGSHVRRTHRRRPARLTMTSKRKTVESTTTTSQEDVKKESEEGDGDDENSLSVVNNGQSSSSMTIAAPRSTTHECANCGALLTTEKAMIQHGLEEHNDSRPFKCRHCDSKYSNVAHRLRHERCICPHYAFLHFILQHFTWYAQRRAYQRHCLRTVR